MTTLNKKIHWAMIALLTISSLSFCKKDWLEEKSDISLTVPSTLKDFQALLDNSDVFNSNGLTLGENSADNIYLIPSVWQSVYTIERNAYTWKPDIYEGEETLSDWNFPFRRIYYANTVLEGVNKINIDENNIAVINNVKGSSLFYRAFAHYEVATIFAPTYDTVTAVTDRGIPLRLSSNFNIPSTRASVQATYAQIIDDLEEAKALVPVTPLFKTRPSKPAVFALLARIYLSMENYAKAKTNADSALAFNNNILNYNSLSTTSTIPMPLPEVNAEIIFHNGMNRTGSLINSYIDTILYSSYGMNDLRKFIFFSSSIPNIKFKGNYNTTSIYSQFNGLATDELYLIKAECLARQGQTQEAMDALNTLLRTRWVTGTFTDFTATDAENALRQILTERRKELLYRGLRWADLRRLNKDDRFKVTLTRKIDNDVYTLPPGDLRYVQLLPPDVIRYSAMQQNPR